MLLGRTKPVPQVCLTLSSGSKPHAQIHEKFTFHPSTLPPPHPHTHTKKGFVCFPLSFSSQAHLFLWQSVLCCVDVGNDLMRMAAHQLYVRCPSTMQSNEHVFKKCHKTPNLVAPKFKIKHTHTKHTYRSSSPRRAYMHWRTHLATTFGL